MVARRSMLAGLGLALLGGPALAVGAQNAARGDQKDSKVPHGFIGKIKAVAGKRAELLSVLTMGDGGMPGCLVYLVAEDVTDPDGLWIVELWDEKASHDASLNLPSVKEAIVKGKPLIAGSEVHIETHPILSASFIKS